MIRRLPVYFLLDTSGSMSGEPIEAVRNGLTLCVSALRGEPQALETAWLSVITFDSDAKQLVPLTDLISFQEPQLKIGGTTALGKALSLLSEKLDTEIKKGSLEEKGDWVPMVFLMTDGAPTDNWQKGLAEIKKRKAKIIACAAGFDADTSVLKQITEIVIQLKSTSQSDIQAFFEWVTASISTQSEKVDSGTDDSDDSGLGELPPPPKELIIMD